MTLFESTSWYVSSRARWRIETSGSLRHSKIVAPLKYDGHNNSLMQSASTYGGAAQRQHPHWQPSRESWEQPIDFPRRRRFYQNWTFLDFVVSDIANVVVTIKKKSAEDINSQNLQARLWLYGHNRLDTLIQDGVSSVAICFRVSCYLRALIMNFVHCTTLWPERGHRSSIH